MGQLLLCNEPIGAMPYYIEGISLNVYTIEELCYYISNNVYLLDSDFMSAELCTWLEQEIHMRGLAEQLRDLMSKKARLSLFVETILRNAYYLSESEIVEVIETLTQLEEKTEFECDKMRADRLMEKSKYLSAVYAYKHLLASEDAVKAEPTVLGNIFHNLGTAYARLFLFKEASDFYKLAYAKNQNPESLQELLLCYRCLGDEEAFQQTALANFVDDASMEQMKKELTSLSRSEEIQNFENELDGLYAKYLAGDKDAYLARVNSQLLKWKEEYRRICRI